MNIKDLIVGKTYYVSVPYKKEGAETSQIFTVKYRMTLLSKDDDEFCKVTAVYYPLTLVVKAKHIIEEVVD
jgi:hypothetical protein